MPITMPVTMPRMMNTMLYSRVFRVMIQASLVENRYSKFCNPTQGLFHRPTV